LSQIVTFMIITYDIISHFLAKFKEENKKTKLWKKREIIKDQKNKKTIKSTQKISDKLKRINLDFFIFIFIFIYLFFSLFFDSAKKSITKSYTWSDDNII